MKKQFMVSAALVTILATLPAAAWWDTWVRAQKSEPLVQAFNAAELNGKQALDDAQAHGGQGSKVVLVRPGEQLTCTIDLKPSNYSVWLIARADEAVWKQTQAATAEDKVAVVPGTETTVKVAGLPVYSSVTVTQPDGKTTSWTLPIAYRDDYRVVSKDYFPWHTTGPCKIAVGLGTESKVGLLVDRIEIRDVLGNCLRQSIRATQSSTDGLNMALATPAVNTQNTGISRNLRDRKYELPAADMPAAERNARGDEIWNWMPDGNMISKDPRFQALNACIGRDGRGLLGDLVEAYTTSGNTDIGMDAAVLLCSMADTYPCLDHYYSETGQYSNLELGGLTWGSRMGKNVYSGWAGGDLTRLADAAAKLHDFMRGNQALADFVHRRIDWVKTPADVIQLIDVNILQHGIDCVNRDVIRDNAARARCLEVLGVKLGTDMPQAVVFSEAARLAEDPSDVELSYNSRGDVHYIGSTLYVGNGKPTDYLGIAGGFPTLIGDAGDLRRGRQLEGPSYPSRVYEGFGAVLLEDGLTEANPLLKRGLCLFRGLGRGHAHQDSLNIELFAHGCRLAPDLGGRHEGKLRSSPNMRLNRMHNMVWIDNREFCNTYPGSTVSGTGWTDSFSPQPGAQYTANRARATSHPTVSLYQRSTAMIDGKITADQADVYFFDVFRVQGGKDHVYTFHGAYSEKVESNVDLKPAVNDAVSTWVLDHRFDKDPMQAAGADPLVMHWPLRTEMQKSYQKDASAADQPVGLTLTLFGHGQDTVYMGGARSDAYPVDMPYLHLYSSGDEGRASVYPAIMEPVRGARAIKATRALAVTPVTTDAERGVAVEVVTTEGRTDTLFSSLKPDVSHKLETGATVSGEFAYISKDAAGVRLLHLVGGTSLEDGEIKIACDRALYSSEITKVDYDGRELTLKQPFPAKVLDTAAALIRTPHNQDTWNLERAAGTSVVLQKRISYYQSHVEAVDSVGGMVVTEREPDIYGPDTQSTIGTVLANESGSKSWRTAYAPTERWMYLGWPNTDLSYPRIVRMEDVPDIDGDGRHVLKMMGNGSEKEPKDHVVLELEVTRTDPEAFTFYFKMPENEDYQTGGWQFVNRWLVNEDGSKRWLATYPGTVNAWKLENATGITMADFPDADGDGQHKVRAYHFGAGDTIEIKTFVYVLRTDKGYEVRANVPCTIALPGLKEAAKITIADLANGVVTLPVIKP